MQFQTRERIIKSVSMNLMETTKSELKNFVKRQKLDELEINQDKITYVNTENSYKSETIKLGNCRSFKIPKRKKVNLHLNELTIID